MILGEEPIELCQKDIYLRLNIAMLESIVEDNELGIGEDPEYFVDTITAIFADSYLNERGELSIDLEGFVADNIGGAFGICYDETFGFALIPAAEDSDLESRTELTHEVLHMRGFAGAADADIANANHGDIELLDREELTVEQPITDKSDRSVNIRERS